jgi:hypothetical protein
MAGCRRYKAARVRRAEAVNLVGLAIIMVLKVLLAILLPCPNVRS